MQAHLAQAVADLRECVYWFGSGIPSLTLVVVRVAKYTSIFVCGLIHRGNATYYRKSEKLYP